MNEQITLDMYMASKRPPEYGERGCHVCGWWHHMKAPGCYWNDDYYLRAGYKYCEYPDCGKFLPDSTKGMPMCDNCEHCNNFIFEDKPENVGNHKKSMYDPLEEPNIYCNHPDGSLNRRTAYKDREQKNFGVGHYHRQHEWDICDRWEPER